jgi:very-short-patch-repair endonuclease
VVGVAERQWGNVTTAQLHACGLSGPVISRWLDEGLLHRVHRTVYAVGHRSPAPEALWSAALLYCGEGAALSHQTALALRGLCPATRTTHVSLVRQVRPQPGMTIHSSMPFQHADLTRAKGLRATSIERSLLDLAATGTPIERLVAEATARRLTSIAKLKAYGELRAGARGARRLRACIEGDQTRSRTEREFVQWLKDRHIPVPLLNEPFGPYTLDCIWRAQRLVLEIDTFDTHGTAHSFETDRRRDAYTAARGLRTIRVTPQRWRNDSDRLARDIVRALSHG